MKPAAHASIFVPTIGSADHRFEWEGVGYVRCPRDRLKSFLEEEQSRLPLGVELRQFTNQAEAISQAVDLFQVKFLVALGVVMLVTLLALGLRAGLIVGIAVPVTLGITFVVMSIVGINLDRITLGALIISLGLLVDDAMISIEMMIVKLEEGWDRVSAAAHAWDVTAAPMLFGTLVTVAGFVPIGFARSGVGEYAGNIFWVLLYSLMVSWVVAVTFTPYLGVMLLPNYKKHDADHDIYQTRAFRIFRSLVRGQSHAARGHRHRRQQIRGQLDDRRIGRVHLATRLGQHSGRGSHHRQDHPRWQGRHLNHIRSGSAR